MSRSAMFTAGEVVTMPRARACAQAIAACALAIGCAVPDTPMQLLNGAGRLGDAGGATDAHVDASVQTTGGKSTVAVQMTNDTGGTPSVSDASVMATGGEMSTFVFPFTTSNVNASTLDLSSVPDVTIDCGMAEVSSTGGNVVLTNWCGATMPTPLVVAQSMGPDLAVIPLGNFTIAAGNTLRLTGEMPVVLVATGNIAVLGTIDATSTGVQAGAGANWMCGTSTGGDGGDGGGGGGGGFGTAGGAGGNGQANGGTAGSARIQRADFSPLVGGCPGGNGGYSGTCTPNGGTAGGAVQLICAGTITVNGLINVSGNDGGPPCASGGGGGGGGSGGGVLLEAQAVDLTGGMITANGGNGAAAGGMGGPGSLGAEVGTGGGQNTMLGGGGGGAGYGRVVVTGQTSCIACP